MEIELFSVLLGNGETIEIEFNEDVLKACGKSFEDIEEKYDTTDLYNSIFKLLEVLQDKVSVE